MPLRSPEIFGAVSRRVALQIKTAQQRATQTSGLPGYRITAGSGSSVSIAADVAVLAPSRIALRRTAPKRFSHAKRKRTGSPCSRGEAVAMRLNRFSTPLKNASPSVAPSPLPSDNNNFNRHPGQTSGSIPLACTALTLTRLPFARCRRYAPLAYLPTGSDRAPTA